MKQKDTVAGKQASFLFEVDVTAVQSGVSDIEDEVRDQLGYAFVAEDARIFRLISVDARNGTTSVVVAVAGASEDAAQEDLTRLLSVSFVAVANGGRIDFSKPRKAAGIANSTGNDDEGAPYTAKDEASNILAGYVSTHPDLDPALADGVAWRQAAELELRARGLGVVKSMSDETLKAIAEGEIDMPAIYESVRKKHDVPVGDTK